MYLTCCSRCAIACVVCLWRVSDFEQQQQQQQNQNLFVVVFTLVNLR